MIDSPWTALTSVEHDLMICANEAWGILAYATNRTETDEEGHTVDLPCTVLGLVDRGWVQVHRLEPWTTPNGQAGATYGPPIPRADIPEVLQDPATWDDPEDPRWIGAVALSVTEAWRALLQRGSWRRTDSAERSKAEIAERRAPAVPD